MAKVDRIIPRFRGSTFERDGGWSYEVMLTIGPEGHHDPMFIGPKAGSPPCINKATAMNEMRAAIIELMKVVCEALEIEVPEDVIDLNEGTIVNAEEFKKPTTYTKEAQ